MTRAVKPERMWAVVAKSQRSRWIINHTIRRTRTESIDRFLTDWLGGGKYFEWSYWRRRGYTVQRVTVTLDANAAPRSGLGLNDLLAPWRSLQDAIDRTIEVTR